MTQAAPEFVQAPTPGVDAIVLDRHVAEDLACTLALLEDWLLHTGDDVHDALTRFAEPGDPHGDASDRITDKLGTFSVALTRALKALDPGFTVRF